MAHEYPCLNNSSMGYMTLSWVLVAFLFGAILWFCAAKRRAPSVAGTGTGGEQQRVGEQVSMALFVYVLVCLALLLLFSLLGADSTRGPRQAYAAPCRAGGEIAVFFLLYLLLLSAAVYAVSTCLGTGRGPGAPAQAGGVSLVRAPSAASGTLPQARLLDHAEVYYPVLYP